MSTTPLFDESQLRAVLAAADRAEAQGRPDEAARLLSTARSLAPEHPAVLAALGIQALRKKNAAEAKALFERAISVNSSDPSLYLNLASSLRELKDVEGELKALDRALALDPFFFLALIQKGSLQELQGQTKRAARTYQRAITTLRPGVSLPKAWQPFVEYAQRAALSGLNELDRFLQSRMEALRQQYSGTPQDRVDDCLGALLGKNRIYTQQPTYTHFPRLPAIQFYDRKDFPWLHRVEEATEDIRAELQAVLADARGEFVPYLQHAPDEPLNQWKELNQSRRWSSLFLFKDGERHEGTIARCPKTVAALEAAPVVRIPHRGPTSFFSLLEPKTRIPPHTGTTNIRLTVHLPLIVPGRCGFRVGTQVREWQPGTALIFDDTIEHEAWNDSDEDRTILIFDIWNPLLTTPERELMTAATAAIAEFYEE